MKKILSRTFHEIFLLERILQVNLFLARFLQDVLQKNALSCKTLKENLARSLQGTHFFSTREALKSCNRHSQTAYDNYEQTICKIFIMAIASKFSLNF